MPDHALRDRLAEWLYETTPRRSAAGRVAWRDLPDARPTKEQHLKWAAALLASKEWEAREAVVKCAQNLDQYMGSDASPTSVWLEFRAALARLAAVRGTT